MVKQKSFADFNMKDWKNFGIYMLLLGLIGIFLIDEWKIGGGLFLIGTIFTGIFQGPKIFKILKMRNW